MKFVLFYHSLVSDWNHGNAHFLRGVAAELLARGHEVEVYEPAQGWSLGQLRQAYGEAPVEEFGRRFPKLRSRFYDPATLDLDEALDGADVALVHEWSEPDLVARVGRHAPRGCRLLFHDTHHRSATAPQEMARYDLSRYHGVLAFGEAIRRRYLEQGWCARAWTWHEAADTRVFRPLPPAPRRGDLVWIGNWGDDERTRELSEFLLDPVRRLGLSARVHGVRYPEAARARLAGAGIEYRDWLPNWRVPETFAQFRVTVHVPRRPYVQALPGIPTIRVFEALACGIPLVCAPWPDEEGLFAPGRDYLVAEDGAAMQRHLRDLLHDRARAAEQAAHGLRTIRARHTCAHRVDQLLAILAELGARPATPVRSLSHA
ncbi:CgeB family protein [Vulcaniibacterium tengchongense]|uniref:Spore maturation protein CgeB n=1 Tax=Vulcaniibacterium tengchongense TaxID=1273429 RepID=A0A3N4VDQ4_9GAMM|nr:glycosyltransferase [Vulcaniibacterium tengchongense]RPE81132.1 spore maturation protein CgeB [Vulcaniibacterium tengchongense]